MKKSGCLRVLSLLCAWGPMAMGGLVVSCKSNDKYMEAPVFVHGLVTRDTGVPLVAVKVVIRNLSNTNEPIVTSMTNSSGNFQFQVRSGNRYLVKVSQDGTETQQVVDYTQFSTSRPTPAFEGTLKLVLQGDQRSGSGGVYVNEPIPETMVAFHGKVLQYNQSPFPYKILVRVENLRTGQEVLQTTTSEEGVFGMRLPVGGIYGYYFERNGFFPSAGIIDLQKEVGGQEKELPDVPLLRSFQQIRESQTSIAFNNVLFEAGSVEFLPESHLELNRVARILKDNPKGKVEIWGYADSQEGGTLEWRKKLSQKRALRVVEYLVQGGVKREVLVAVGKGDFPRPSAKTPPARSVLTSAQSNRRVELQVISWPL